MIIPESIRKSVVFIGYQLANGQMQMAGSAFYLGRDIADARVNGVYLVTAKHVIEGIRRRGLTEVFVRANMMAGQSSWLKCQSEDWLFHPTDETVDVAMIRTSVPAELDHLIIPLTHCVTPKVLETNAVGLGDEVFVVGLFRHHHGTLKNIPIVRVGNLAAMAEEKVSTGDFGLIDAYLIEARSIGGLSGSPVFLNLGVVRHVDGKIKYSQGGPIYFLLGLIHGHYDVPSSAVDNTCKDAGVPLSTESINTGIAIVVPIEKIVEVMEAHTQAGPHKSL